MGDWVLAAAHLPPPSGPNETCRLLAVGFAANVVELWQYPAAVCRTAHAPAGWHCHCADAYRRRCSLLPRGRSRPPRGLQSSRGRARTCSTRWRCSHPRPAPPAVAATGGCWWRLGLPSARSSSGSYPRLVQNQRSSEGWTALTTGEHRNAVLMHIVCCGAGRLHHIAAGLCRGCGSAGKGRMPSGCCCCRARTTGQFRSGAGQPSSLGSSLCSTA